MPALAPIVDSNVHLWDGSQNAVFWLADRSLVRDLIGDYDSLPDVYTLRDYEAETASLGVRGIVWSDAGAADPVAAAEWVQRQDDGRGLVTGLVSLGDPASPDFVDLLDRLARVPLVHSVRVRLASGLAPDGGGSGSEVGFLDRGGVMRHFAVMADRGLVATIEATGEQLDAVARLADEVRELRIVVDHFGWPTDLSDAGRAVHRQRLTELAARPNVATRLDAIGTIFGSWTIEQVSPWLRSVVDVFGPDRCMLGSDLPIERLRSSFAGLYDAYGQIFADLPAEARADLFGRSAERWYGNG